MTEMLVLFACLNDTGCSESYKTYYYQHPALQEYADIMERKFVKAYAFEYIAPFVLAASGESALLKLDRNYSVNVSIKQISLSFNKEW